MASKDPRHFPWGLATLSGCGSKTESKESSPMTLKRNLNTLGWSAAPVGPWSALREYEVLDGRTWKCNSRLIPLRWRNVSYTQVWEGNGIRY
jgi:hypothetical protein